MAGGVKFLLVDDIDENLLALEALLRRDDLEILKARSGRDALELLLVHEVALAFVDVQMPEMDGFELAELMRGSERTRQVPIIFVTAGVREPDRVFKGYEAGAVDFLFKPLTPRIVRQKADIFFELYRGRRRLAEQLDELRASAVERERLVGELQQSLRLAEMFAAVLGHDLRNPLTVITSSAEQLARKSGDEAIRRSMDRTLSSARRMGRLIDELLDLSRARLAGGIPLAPSRVDLRALCQKVLAEHEVSHPQRRLDLQVEGDPCGVWDEDRLFQALSNLMGNAVQHGRPDTPIRLRVAATSTSGEVTIETSNAGAIPAELRPHLFDPFHVVRRKRERSQGLGLGLYIVQQIVLAHGGVLDVSSSEETGTTFTIRLPRAAALEERRLAR